MSIHTFTESVYDEIFKNFDQVAEHQKMYGYMPLVSIKEYLENSTIKKVKPFSTTEEVKAVIEELDALRKEASELEMAAMSWIGFQQLECSKFI